MNESILAAEVKFQSTHLVWGATIGLSLLISRKKISIHAPRVRCDVYNMTIDDVLFNFNPRTSCEVRPLKKSTLQLVMNFNPRTSCEVRQENNGWLQRTLVFQSTHLVWGATFRNELIVLASCISIHAPRVRCDGEESGLSFTINISIHAPRVRCDLVGEEARKNTPISIHAPRVRCDIPYKLGLMAI